MKYRIDRKLTDLVAKHMPELWQSVDDDRFIVTSIYKRKPHTVDDDGMIDKPMPRTIDHPLHGRLYKQTLIASQYFSKSRAMRQIADLEVADAIVDKIGGKVLFGSIYFEFQFGEFMGRVVWYVRDDDPFVTEAVPEKPQKKKSRKKNVATPAMTNQYAEYFKLIPTEIEAPVNPLSGNLTVLIGVAVLILLNIVAIIVIMSQL